MNSSLPGFSVHGDSPGKNIGVGCHAFLQGILPTQGSAALQVDSLLSEPPGKLTVLMDRVVQDDSLAVTVSSRQVLLLSCPATENFFIFFFRKCFKMHASFSKHPQGTLCPLSLAFGWARLSVNHPPPHSGEGGARSSQENTHPPPPSIHTSHCICWQSLPTRDFLQGTGMFPARKEQGRRTSDLP